jgi:hypothetical protein
VTCRRRVGDCEREAGAAPPTSGGGLAKRVGKSRSGQFARQQLRQRQLPSEHVGGHAGEVALHLVDLISAGLRLLEPVLHDVEVAVEQIDPLVLHRQPSTAIYEPPPRPRLDHGALEAERAHVVGADRVAVVEPEVPVAIRMGNAARA